MTEHIKTHKDAGILTIVIDRPEKKNALTDAMYRAMTEALTSAESSAEVRVVLFRGEGDMFTAGNDIGEFAATAMSGESPRSVMQFLHALATATKPIVAAVHGSAVGIGTTLLLHCDQVVLAENTKLLTPFVNLALVPEAASSLLLPARIGYARAYAMFALGDPVSATDALAWGLANAVVPASELVTAASALARRLAEKPLGALVTTKKLMRNAEAISRQIEVESVEFVARLKSPEAREAFTAFAERRKPDFTRVG